MGGDMVRPDMEQRPETAGRMADEDRAYTARMLGGCGWIGLAALAIGFVLTGWKFWPAVEAALGVVR